AEVWNQVARRLPRSGVGQPVFERDLSAADQWSGVRLHFEFEVADRAGVQRFQVNAESVGVPWRYFHARDGLGQRGVGRQTRLPGQHVAPPARDADVGLQELWRAVERINIRVDFVQTRPFQRGLDYEAAVGELTRVDVLKVA